MQLIIRYNNTMRYKKERDRIVRISKKLYRLGLVTLRGGNVSLRIGNHILITPKGKSYIRLKPEQIVLIDFNGKVLEGDREPSTEYRLHLEIYKSRNDINTVIHTHSLFACTVACLNLEIPIVFEEQEILLGKIPTVSYSPCGSLELAEKVATSIKDSKAVLIERHGAVIVGRGLTEALEIAELVERVCKIFYFVSLFKSYVFQDIKHSP